MPFALLGAFVAAATGAATAAPVGGSDVTYTTDADFDKGVLDGVNHDAPNKDQLQLNERSATFRFIWVPLSQRCTVAKIDTDTGAILGEYGTASDAGSCSESYSTAVARDGSVWVGHRGTGGVTHVGLRELGQCVDRNGSGVIETSAGYGDVRPWPGLRAPAAAALDECILHHVDTAAVGLPSTSGHVSIDANDKLWVGSWEFYAGGGARFIRLDASTGAVETAARSLACGGNGGLIDRDGVIWSSDGGLPSLLRWDPDAPDSATNPRCIPVPNWGLAADQNGFVWATDLSYGVLKLSADGNTILGPFLPFPGRPDRAGDGSGYGPMVSRPQGVAIDAKGDAWVSSSLFCTSDCVVGHLKNDGTLVGMVPAPTGAGGTGVSVDAAGKVWTANYSNTATRIDPAGGALGCGGSGCGDGTRVGAVDLTVSFPATPPPGPGDPPRLPVPFTYGDGTGLQRLSPTGPHHGSRPAPHGTWTVVQDGGTAGFAWGRVSWHGSVPPGATLRVEVRAADAEAGLARQRYSAVANGTSFARPGRYVQVRVTMRPEAHGNGPVLADIRVRKTGH